jgi:hypothetical protein
MKRSFLIVGIIIFSLLTPLSFLPALLIINSINPMALAFIVPFDVINESGEMLIVTPVGTFNDGGKSVLPTYIRRFPAIPRLARQPYRIAPGETQRIFFDCDDINFSELAIQNASGEFRQLVTDPNPPTKDYYAPRKNLFTIPKWSELQPIDSSVLITVNRKRSFIHSWWTMGAFSIPPFILAVFLYALILDKKRQLRIQNFRKAG